MKKIYKSLTEDQKARGVIFSSTLSKYTTEQGEDIIHEVFQESEAKNQCIKRLLDDSFFDGSPWKYNIIRQ